MANIPADLPDFVQWPSFPFEGQLRLKPLDPPAVTEPPRRGEDVASCKACMAPDEAYIWVSERWRVRAMDRPTGLPMMLILESRSHLDLGDLPNLLASELGVMTVRLERAIRSLEGVARVHVNHWGDGSAHLHMWFLARPYGRLQLRGPFLALWDDILPSIPEAQWRENLALVAAWLADFGGRAFAEPPRIDWRAPSTVAAAVREAAGGIEDPDASPTDSISFGLPTRQLREARLSEDRSVHSGGVPDERAEVVESSPRPHPVDAATELATVWTGAATVVSKSGPTHGGVLAGGAGAPAANGASAPGAD